MIDDGQFARLPEAIQVQPVVCQGECLKVSWWVSFQRRLTSIRRSTAVDFANRVDRDAATAKPLCVQFCVAMNGKFTVARNMLGPALVREEFQREARRLAGTSGLTLQYRSVTVARHAWLTSSRYVATSPHIQE